MIPSKVYSKALYDLAEEIDKNEGCVTCSSVLVEGAAERIDVQTVTIRGLEIQRDELLVALEHVVSAWSEQFEIYGHLAPAWVIGARKAISSIKGQSA